jgi:hypothetical protein
MKDLLLFVSAILVYFALAYGLYRIYRWNFISYVAMNVMWR